jgi:ATP-binding cassette subfamily B protein
VSARVSMAGLRDQLARAAHHRTEALRLLALARRGPTAAFLATAGVQGLAPVALVVVVGVTVSRAPAAFDHGLDSPDGRALLRAVGAMAVVLVVERLATAGTAILRTVVTRQVDGMLRDRALTAVEHLPSLDRLEGPSLQNQLTLVRGSFLGTPGNAATATVMVGTRYLQTLASAVVVGWFSVPVALYGLVVIFGVRRRWHVAFREVVTSMLANSGRLRMSSYFTDLVLLPAAAKEIRVFGLVDWLVGRQRHFWTEAVAPGFELRRRMRHRSNIELVALLSSALLTAVLAARAAARGELGLGLFVAILQAQIVAAGLIGPTADDYTAEVAATGLDALREMETAARPDDPPAPAALPAGAPVDEIRFEQVSFTYPGATDPVLQDLDLTVRAGQSLAIVGANGAGKTTIVKLLCGLYRPDRGRISVDGLDLAELDPGQWQRRIGVVFQDFTHYEMSASDNVTLGWGRDRDDEARDRAARLAGAERVVTGLPRSWDTVLARQYDGGCDLSGGEWQRVALARALYTLQVGGSLLVLDEPTANLDVRSETRLFDELLAATPGTTTILISHRFSSVRKAHRIVVVDRGRVIEEGDHGSLMAADGAYAAMFRLQAEHFLEATGG